MRDSVFDGNFLGLYVFSRYAVGLVSGVNVIFGMLFFYTDDFGLLSSAIYSCICAVVSLIGAVSLENRFRSWLFWFTLTYFIFYQFGTILGTFVNGFSIEFIDYATNFSSELSEGSASKSYILSGLCISIVWLFSLFNRTDIPASSLKFEPDLMKVALILMFFSYPFLFFDLIGQLSLIGENGYAFLYTESFQKRESSVPFVSVFSVIYTLSFFIFLASRPPAMIFVIISIGFLLMAVVDSFKGSRTALIVPFIFLMWYSVVFYNLKLRFSRLVLIGILAMIFAYSLQLTRSSGEVDLSSLWMFLVRGLSTAQHTLAVVLDNASQVHIDSVFVIEPLIFPFKLLLFGSDVVGQSMTTAMLRADLNHTFSSQLNLNAYLSGAGMGSSFVAESVQFGPFLMIFVIFIWFKLNSWFFRKAQSNRFFLALVPPVFMHLLMSPRATVFVNSWAVVKTLIFLLFVVIVIKFLLEVSAGRSSSNDLA